MNEKGRAGKNGLLEWVDGSAYFRGLRVNNHDFPIAGRTCHIVGLDDPAGLLDQPDFARRFIEEDKAPYGLELWPASMMLTEWILAVAAGNNRSALDLGCGLGVVAIAATWKGWQVTAADHEPTTLSFAAYNAELNNTRVHDFTLLDWHRPPSGRSFDRVFGADLLYQRGDHVPILTCIEALLAPDGIAVLADPHRRVADRFAELAQEHGFAVESSAASTTNSTGRRIDGRILCLRREREAQTIGSR